VFYFETIFRLFAKKFGQKEKEIAEKRSFRKLSKIIAGIIKSYYSTRQHQVCKVIIYLKSLPMQFCILGCITHKIMKPCNTLHKSPTCSRNPKQLSAESRRKTLFQHPKSAHSSRRRGAEVKSSAPGKQRDQRRRQLPQSDGAR
jgi:hypothetical protein